jgi:hypothetical protein
MNLTHKHATRPGVLGALALASVAVLIAGCGGGSSSNGGVAHLSSNAGSSTTIGSAAGQGSGSPEAEALAYANCMRSHGMPNFPDPKPGGGFLFHASPETISSPAFKAAQAKCQKLLPEGPGSGPPPSAQTLAHYLKVAQCMRTHGVPDFPDPRTTVPPNPRAVLKGGGGVISDIEGVILVFPGTIDEQSPLFTRAAATCAFPLHNH